MRLACSHLLTLGASPFCLLLQILLASRAKLGGLVSYEPSAKARYSPNRSPYEPTKRDKCTPSCHDRPAILTLETPLGLLSRAASLDSSGPLVITRLSTNMSSRKPADGGPAPDGDRPRRREVPSTQAARPFKVRPPMKGADGGARDDHGAPPGRRRLGHGGLLGQGRRYHPRRAHNQPGRHQGLRRGQSPSRHRA